ncbi:hypothetical protein ILUMI_26603 [Ignelater luminosus]|uniref:DDE-1 domain-containing protein n=1 Tax=Ignelater luminosus TaxID=2038154 RepID=A0A8K0C473_IGNLU|nr:hypothetical protein ILUMI_26603 [Ignelater luminosus]
MLNNHNSHNTLAAINYSRENGIVLLPSSRHRMQPLGIGVFGPFKNRVKTSFNDYMLMNPGKPVNIDDISALFTEPYLLSFTPSEEGFDASYVTDRPVPNLAQNKDEHLMQNKIIINVISNIAIKNAKDVKEDSHEIATYCLAKSDCCEVDLDDSSDLDLGVQCDASEGEVTKFIDNSTLQVGDYI